MKKKISFIIPIYNTKLELLERCFNSISELKKIKYEVLLIDDGSEAYIEEFCNKYIKNFSNFYYFKKNNEGVSQARNLGIEMAKGDYIFFVDSDDTINTKNLDNLSLKEDVDLILFDFDLIEKKIKLKIQVLNFDDKEINLKSFILNSLIDNKLNSTCAKLYKKDMLLKNKIFFDKKIATGEDLNFNLDFLMNNPRIIYEKKVLYSYYREEISSINRLLKYKERLIENYSYLQEKKLKILDKLDLDFQEKNFFIKKLLTIKIKSIFNLIIDAEAEKILTLNFKNKVKESINADLKNIKYLTLFMKIRYFLMYFELWKLIKIIGNFRELYLKIRKVRI